MTGIQTHSIYCISSKPTGTLKPPVYLDIDTAGTRRLLALNSIVANGKRASESLTRLVEDAKSVKEQETKRCFVWDVARAPAK
jgi:hypothetical protein